MTSFRFLHAADLHLDSPLRGLERYEGAPTERIRGATRQALVRLVDLALEEEVALVILAGDLYDGDWKDYNTGLFFRAQTARLAEAGTRVVLIHGNHDAASKITRKLRPQDHVHVLPSKAPGTVTFDDLGLAVHGRSYPTERVEENIALDYPAPVPGLLNFGVLHTALEGKDPAHASYAKCTPAQLRDHGYDYWALGHVHERRTVLEEPWICFPGNTQGRHARETGAKGCLLVEVSDGVVRAPEFRALDVVRWARLEIDAAGAADADEVLGRVRRALDNAVDEAEGRLLAARVEIVGASEAHEALASRPEHTLQSIRALGIDLVDGVWIEKVELRTRRPLDLDERLARGDALADLARGLLAEAEDADPGATARAALEEIATRLPHGLRSHLDDDDAVEVERRARDLLVGRLLLGEEDA